ncbi:hypothetical protein SAMN04488005_0218 [Yoonia tamlensis]|uniref:Uncharacterized protein n=1 Tax=Yoonia tamlensis TaxID=390270 RepID=A0A1I6FPT7_9RHOB|nr:hypothetical protein [Yoonia tamlensis]SFR31962.1 hypothetical protein SAMN04488005_0218 [Yoonia tamlensis]
MGELIADSLFLPALIIAALGFVVPRLLAQVLPEGVTPLMLNALLSTLILFLIVASFFVGLYLWQGMPFAQIMAPGWAENISFFGRLGLMSAIIWGPIMLLSVAALPRKWVNKTW